MSDRSTPETLPVGTRIKDFVVMEQIGRGGMGTIYRGVNPELENSVAIKVLSARVSGNPEIAARFEKEARLLGKLKHPHIVDVYSCGRLPSDEFYFIMEHLDGVDLGEQLERAGPMSLADALPILRQVALALDAAHEQGIVHRDVKPSNIFLCQRPGSPPLVKLLDFGVAKVLDPDQRGEPVTAQIVGSPPYMSPEQRAGRRVDHLTDVYALAAVAHRMLTGTHVPCGTGESDGAAPPVLQSGSSGAPLTASLVAALRRGLHPRRRYRQPTASALVAALGDDQPSGSALPQPRPHRTIWLAAVGVALLAAVGFAVALRWPVERVAGEPGEPAPGASLGAGAAPDATQPDEGVTQVRVGRSADAAPDAAVVRAAAPPATEARRPRRKVRRRAARRRRPPRRRSSKKPPEADDVLDI